MSNRPIYKLVDSKGRVLIPKNLREAAKWSMAISYV